MNITPRTKKKELKRGLDFFDEFTLLLKKYNKEGITLFYSNDLNIYIMPKNDIETVGGIPDGLVIYGKNNTVNDPDSMKKLIRDYKINELLNENN